jgi:hypothetical protein
MKNLITFESFINEGAFVVYIDGPKGKELLGTFHNRKAAEKYKKEEEDEVLNTAGVESIGTMSKDMWDKKEAPYIKEAVNEAKVTKKDFDKVVKILSKSKYPFTIMLVPKWDEIDIITGQDSPDAIGDDIIKRLDSAGLNWGGNSGITISGDSSNYSRREYDEIAEINGGHKHY